jgi:hypothetical protein
LFQMRFLPDLMQVNFFPPAVAVAPALVHFAPALGVAACSGAATVRSRAIANAIGILRVIIMASWLCPYREDLSTEGWLGQDVRLHRSS